MQDVINRKDQEVQESKAPGHTLRPRVDIRETEEAVYLEAEMPGVAQEDVDVRLEDGELQILGRVSLTGPADCERRRTEYACGNFERVFRLAETIDPDKIEAKMTNGVLRLYLPKRESAKPRSIKVNVA